MTLRVYFRVRGVKRFVGVLSKEECCLDDERSILSLLVYLLSFLPHRDHISEVTLDGEDVAVRVDPGSLRVLVLGPSQALFKFRELLALRRESEYLDSLNSFFKLGNGSFISDPFDSLKTVEREVKSKLRGRVRREFCRALKSLKNSMNFIYERVLIDEEQYSYTGDSENVKNYSKKCVVDKYEVGSFSVKICESNEGGELYYNVEYPSRSYLIALGSRFLSYILTKDADVEVEYKMKLDELIDYRSLKSRGIIKRSLREVPSNILDILSKVSTYRSLGLLKLMPFLLDNNICEFYVDAPDTLLYLDHFKHGRCISNVKISMNDLLSFITHVKLECGSPLDPENPSLKADISNKLFRIRVSIDIPPLAVDGPTIDVRKFRMSPFTLPELITMGTLPLEVASLILLYARHRANIVIVGEPGSGKTTLLNAIDICLPNFFRRIYVEDVVESIPLHNLGKHQVRLRVEPIEVLERVRTKRSEILKLLHRKPDYVILGELQSREHFEAALSAMISGLRCIQTCHANSVKQFLNRLIHDYGFPSNLVRKTYDLIIMLRRYIGVREFRRVVQVVEIAKNDNECLTPIYSYPTKVKIVDHINSSDFFKRVCDDEGVFSEGLVREYELYRSALEYMVQRRIFNVNEVVSLFNKIVYKYVFKLTGEVSCLALERALKLR